MADAGNFDRNNRYSLFALSNADGIAPVSLWADPVSHSLLVSASFSPSGTQDVNVIKVGGSTLTIGQQTAANSIPVILPSATITTLTPPSNTGYALDSSLTTIDTDIKSNITLHAGTNLVGKFGIDQTTPGTTNLVALSAETTKVIGTVNQGTSPWVTNDPGIPDTLGQKARASSAGVTLSSEDITALTPPAAITGFATATAQTDKSQFTKLTDGTDTALITASGEQNVLATAQPGVDIGDVTINNSTGGSAVNIQDGGNTISVDDSSGSLTVDAPVGTPVFVRLSDGSSAITTLPVSVAATLTTKEIRSATPSQTSPSITNSSTSILASNTNRLGFTIYNEGTAICYMKLGATASTTSYTIQIAVGGYYECPFNYTGAVDGITSASTAQLRVTELSA